MIKSKIDNDKDTDTVYLKMIKMTDEVVYFKCKTVLGAKKLGSKLYKSDISWLTIEGIVNHHRYTTATFNCWTNDKRAVWTNHKNHSGLSKPKITSNIKQDMI